MPNWTNNEITLRGDKEKLDAFKQRVAGESGAIDFNRLVPMPEHSETFYADGPIGEEEQQKYGRNNWYDWSTEHWGTKWNACRIETAEHDDTLVYNFDTAWDCPRPLVEPIADLAHALGLTIGWECDHEDGGEETIL